jgi:hypothetical protein
LTDKVAQQLAEVADQLRREFAPAGGIAAEVVRGHVQQVRAGFGSPKVLTYLVGLGNALQCPDLRSSRGA